DRIEAVGVVEGRHDLSSADGPPLVLLVAGVAGPAVRAEVGEEGVAAVDAARGAEGADDAGRIVVRGRVGAGEGRLGAADVQGTAPLCTGRHQGEAQHAQYPLDGGVQLKQAHD